MQRGLDINRIGTARAILILLMVPGVLFYLVSRHAAIHVAEVVSDSFDKFWPFVVLGSIALLTAVLVGFAVSFYLNLV